MKRYTDEQIDQLRQLVAGGMSIHRAARTVGVKPLAAYRRLRHGREACAVCCDKFPLVDMIGSKCRVCAQAPYLTPKHTPDDRDLWPFNPDATGFNTFLRQRRAP